MPNGRHDDQAEERPDFEAFYRGALRAVVNAAYITTRDMSAAEDAAQDAFIEIHNAWPLWVNKPWKQKVAHAKIVAIRRSIDEQRRRGLLRNALERIGGGLPGRSSTVAAFTPGPWAGSFTHVESDVMARELVTLVLSIPSPRQRGIAVLAFLVDLSAEQIAEELGIKASTVRTVTSRLRERFRAAHVEMDVDDAAVEQVGRRDS